MLLNHKNLMGRKQWEARMKGSGLAIICCKEILALKLTADFRLTSSCPVSEETHFNDLK
jgi:hypothetical protein